MSVSLMNEVWKTELPITRKLVLLALADIPSERGERMECYPSIETLARKCSMKPRAIYDCLRDLERWGYILRKQRQGHSTVYQFMDPSTWTTHATDAPLHLMHPTPAYHAPTPASHAPTPASHAPTPASHAPITRTNQQITRIEPAHNQRAREENTETPSKKLYALPGIAKTDIALQKTGSRFDEFKAAYPPPFTRERECFEVWQSQGLERLSELIIADVDQRKREDVSWLDGWGPEPLSYLKNNRWSEAIKTRRRGKKTFVPDGIDLDLMELNGP